MEKLASMGFPPCRLAVCPTRQDRKPCAMSKWWAGTGVQLIFFNEES